MTEGFFHADPHPGNMKWWKEKIYFLDLGTVGEVDAELRELVLLIMLTFSQRDAAFLSEVVLMLADADSDVVDIAAFRGDLERVIGHYRDLSLSELRLGPMLREVTEISVRRNVRVPASLALMGKAFDQMQMAAELDPTLDPFSVAETFVLPNTLRQLAGSFDPKKVFCETQKMRIRLVRLLEAVEGSVGAMPGARLQVDFRGTEPLEEPITRASRRLSFALGLGGALVGAAVAADAERVPRWMPAPMSGIGSALAAGLLIDSSRRKR
jgi:ubiquinone biosynthesis protein